jgi:hypothetical protein
MSDPNQRADPATADELVTQTIRKCYQIGHSWAVTLPARWVKNHMDHARPYCLVTSSTDGRITITPLDAALRTPND